MTCSQCLQQICDHSDAVYAGIVPEAMPVSPSTGTTGGGASCPAPDPRDVAERSPSVTARSEPTSALHAEILAWLATTQMSESEFGRRSINDARLLDTLRRGRVPGASVSLRVRKFMAETSTDPMSEDEAAAAAYRRRVTASSARLNRAIHAAYARIARMRGVTIAEAAVLAGMRGCGQ